jgi:hypothetical protein
MSDNNALEQAQAQADSIAAMVAALNVDYDRLEELKNELESLEFDVEHKEWEDKQKAIETLVQWRLENAEELKELEEAANGNTSGEEAREAIQGDALDIQVRAGWRNPSEMNNSPEEFSILLCTGGPAVRIMGELDDNCEPCRAYLQCQDWGTPWLDCVGIIDQETLLTYCQQFYFGE